jgi:lipid IVA palmitoyltransferase
MDAMFLRRKNSLLTTSVTASALLLLLAFARPASAAGLPASSSDTVKTSGARYAGVRGHLRGIWEKGGYEWYEPVYTYHLPYAYSPSLLRSYNDFPAGIGLGKGRFNEHGNWEGVFAMEFADSHGRPEYEGGYGWIATWHPFSNLFRAGAGLTAFITARSDIMRYTPFPGVLPLGSLGYRNVDLQATFIPGGRNNGNVLFTWIKLSFY